MTTQLSELQHYFKKCSDCSLHPDYIVRMRALLDQPLTQELVDYLCEKSTSTKHWPELRFAHLRILLLNQSSHSFDLKQWYFDSWTQPPFVVEDVLPSWLCHVRNRARNGSGNETLR